jgi:hypothetical protein
VNSGGGGQGGERKNRFVKDDIPGNIYAPLGGIKTLEPLVYIAIAEENTSSRS